MVGNTPNNIRHEYKSALKDPALSDKWSKLIAYHPTEWQAKGNDPKWSRLETDILKGEANNQADKLCLSAFRKTSIHYYVKPKGYVVSETLEKLPILKIEGGVLSYEQTR